MKHSYLLAGISSGKLFRLLIRNGFSFYPKYLFRLIFLFQGSVFATLFNRIQKKRLGKQLKDFSMPQDPIFIIGHWRTGTTLLHQLMALDKNLVTPNVFRVSAPGSFLISEKYYRPVMSKVMKPTRPMDNVRLGFDMPQEEEYALIKLTTDSPLEKLIFPKGKGYFLIDYTDFYPDHIDEWKKAFSDFCNRLSFINGKRVLLKNPFHSMRIPLILEFFPKAKFIHVHRHPFEVIPSTIHMWNIVGSENKLNGKKIHNPLNEVAFVYDRVLEYINEQFKNLPEEAKVEIGFKDLETNPSDTIKSIYKKLDLEYKPEFKVAINKWLEDTKSYQKNRYQLEESEKETIRKIMEKHFIYYNYAQ